MRRVSRHGKSSYHTDHPISSFFSLKWVEYSRRNNIGKVYELYFGGGRDFGPLVSVNTIMQIRKVVVEIAI